MSLVLLNGSDPNFARSRGTLIRELTARGHGVHISSPGFTIAARAEIEAAGAVAHEIGLSRTGISLWGNFLYMRRMHKLIRAHSFDYVLNFTIKPNIFGTFAAWLVGASATIFVTGLGYAFLEAQTWRHRAIGLASRHLYRLATSCAHRVVLQNQDDVRDMVAAKCIYDASKIIVTNGSGVDLEHFALSRLPDKPIFLMATRLLKSKGVKEYLEAAVEAHVHLSDSQFLLAGPFDEGPDALHPEDFQSIGPVRYLGAIEDIRTAIGLCSVFVLPSYREGTPRAVLEAMAMGRPIITTEAPGCRETTLDGVNGRLVPVRDSNALAAAMIELGSDSQARVQMGLESRRRAEHRYSARTVNSELLDALGI